MGINTFDREKKIYTFHIFSKGTLELLRGDCSSRRGHVRFYKWIWLQLSIKVLWKQWALGRSKGLLKRYRYGRATLVFSPSIVSARVPVIFPNRHAWKQAKISRATPAPSLFISPNNQKPRQQRWTQPCFRLQWSKWQVFRLVIILRNRDARNSPFLGNCQ